MEDVRQELYDDINVLDSNVESECPRTSNIFSSSKNQNHQFSPEVKLQAKICYLSIAQFQTIIQFIKSKRFVENVVLISKD